MAPLDPLAWMVVLGSAAVGTAGAEVVPALVAWLREEPTPAS